MNIFSIYQKKICAQLKILSDSYDSKSSVNDLPLLSVMSFSLPRKFICAVIYLLVQLTWSREHAWDLDAHHRLDTFALSSKHFLFKIQTGTQKVYYTVWIQYIMGDIMRLIRIAVWVIIIIYLFVNKLEHNRKNLQTPFFLLIR